MDIYERTYTRSSEVWLDVAVGYEARTQTRVSRHGTDTDTRQQNPKKKDNDHISVPFHLSMKHYHIELCFLSSVFVCDAFLFVFPRFCLLCCSFKYSKTHLRQIVYSRISRFMLQKKRSINESSLRLKRSVKK